AIADWQSQQASRYSYQQALLVAETGTVNALIRAIKLAQGVPNSSPDWSFAQQAVNEWSWDVLGVAESTAYSNPTEAVNIAQQIPPGTAAYPAAQQRLQEWQTPLIETSTLDAVDQ
ncbi:MAG: hypothetical protein AAF827_18495, partial [Cyanobacteria bacterium P01_D01_bin.6]